MVKEIRWEQRFANYNRALQKLSDAVAFIEEQLEDEELEIHKGDASEVLNEIIKEGLIQRFKYTHELAWNLMKDFLSEIGNLEIHGSKDATRAAFQAGLIRNGEVWMEMIKSRNKTSHTYNKEIAEDIFSKVVSVYYAEFSDFQHKMESQRSGEQSKMF